MTGRTQWAPAAVRVVPRASSSADRRPQGRSGAMLTSMATVDRLLERSDAELVAATFASEAAERFVHAHLAALRAGAALVEARAAVSGMRPARRGRPRPVWELVAALEPGLGGWTAVFAAAAPLRAAVETGRGDVDEERADLALTSAEAFQDEVRQMLAGAGTSGVARGGAALRAS